MNTSTPEPVIQAHGLSKRYGGIMAVNDLTLSIAPGEIYGFLGANGAGKTTTLRMLLGLIGPTSGSIRILGHPAGSENALRQIGSMIETPAFYPHLSGRQNLALLARLTDTPRSRIDTVLDQVRLGKRGKDAFRTYSLGMKQRLGVAAALLKSPSLLILDEPTNGLDPAGMAEMRQLVRDLGTAGQTIVVSSHLMPEIEFMCDRVGIIDRGQMIAEGTIRDLCAGGTLSIDANPLVDAERLIRQAMPRAELTIANDAIQIAAERRGAVDAAALNTLLVREGINVHGLTWQRTSLEHVFLALTGRTADSSEGDAPSASGTSRSFRMSSLISRTPEVAHV